MGERIKEFYKAEPSLETPKRNIYNVPPKFYKQERDWTCAIAMLRTLLSNCDTLYCEHDFVELIGKPQPIYSKDIKQFGC